MKILAISISLLLVSCATPYDITPPPDPGEIEGLGVLVFTKIAGFRHPSIKDGVETLQELGSKNNWTVIQTDNGAAFNESYLSKFDVVIWLSTTWDVLSEAQEEAFQRYIEHGGGYVGIHAASDTEYDWPWYGETLLGTWFNNHPNFPNVRNADVIIEQPDHPATRGLPAKWNRDDEWYNFKSNPRDNPSITVLASLDESSYDAGDGAMGDHPIIWCREINKGRMLYSGLGHTSGAFSDTSYQIHLIGAVHWAGRVVE